jgi:hypothetical protein
MIGPQLSCKGKFDDHIITIAARKGDEQMMTALLKLCPEYADLICPGKATPLMMTKLNEDSRAAEVARVLLATGTVAIDATDEYEGTALTGAFRYCKLELCKVLIGHGADMSRIIRFDEHGEPVCVTSCGFPARDEELQDALLEFSCTQKHAD